MERSHSSNSTSPIGVWGRRGLWAVLLLLHGAAVPSLLRHVSGALDPSELANLLVRVVGLGASAGFFALKIIDVPCLRLRPGWQSVVAAVLVVALLHVGVVDRTLGGDPLGGADWGAAWLALALVVVAASDSSNLMWQLRRLAVLFASAWAWIAPRSTHFWGWVVETWSLPLEPALPAMAGPRAPPAN